MIQFTSVLQKFDPKLFGYHFPVPVDIAHKFVDGNNRRVICNVNNQLKMQCALIPYSHGFFILINKPKVKRLGLTVGGEVELTLEKDHSEYGHEVPQSFAMLLEQDDEGSKYFDKLTPGKKRSLIYLVGKVKNVDSQLNKGLAILDHLKLEQGNLDFKKLNQLIKDYNQRSKLQR